MKTHNGKFLNTILAFGLIFILFGFLILIGFAGDSGQIAFSVFPLIVCITGLAILYIYIGFSRTAFKFFSGLALTLCGMFWLIVTRNIIPNMTTKKIWPALMIIISFSLFVAARTKNKHLILSYDLPALSLAILGAIFMLFSLGIIKIPFYKIAIFAGPVILILSGIFLIILFIKRKALLEILPEEISNGLSGKNDIIDTNSEESDVL